MTFTPILAQAAPGAGDFLGMILPLVLIMGVFYFLLIRPQQQKAKAHAVTHGGLIGKVTKLVDDNELLVEVGKGVEVRVLRGGIFEIRK
jgi:preprotein translocase subunit YajC